MYIYIFEIFYILKELYIYIYMYTSWFITLLLEISRLFLVILKNVLQKS